MKSLSAVVLGVAVLGLSAGAVRAQDDYAKKIVGLWVIDKSSGDLPPGTTIEFTKDGKLTATFKDQDKEVKNQPDPVGLTRGSPPRSSFRHFWTGRVGATNSLVHSGRAGSRPCATIVIHSGSVSRCCTGWRNS